MQNLENVISSLEALNHAAPSQIFRDAITFLKMKEPTKAIWLYDRPNHWRCSECGAIYDASHVFMNYCAACGSRIKKG